MKILKCYPINSKRFSIFFYELFEDSPIFFDRFPRSRIVIISTQKNPLESYLLSLIESESEHMFRISLPSRTRAKSISDISSRIPEIWMIYMVSYLDRSEDIILIHKKEESAVDSAWIVGQVSRDDREKFLICISRKKSSWACGRRFW